MTTRRSPRRTPKRPPARPAAAAGASIIARTVNALYGNDGKGEKRFMQRVIGLARAYGWLPYHGWTSLHSEAGFPDLCLVRPPRLVFAELKLEGKRLTPSQERWLTLLGQVPGVEAYRWSPAGWPQIDAALQPDPGRPVLVREGVVWRALG